MGKTTLVFQLLNQLKLTSRAVLLFQTQCDSRELLRYVLSGLGPDATAQVIVTMHERLNQVLARELLAGRRLVLIIDCPNLDNSVLETVRLLSDFETPQTKLMQIILVGQTQLAEKLSSTNLTQLRQRISILCRLEPLAREEILGYIERRLRLAGYAGPPLFSATALERILRHSEGIPRNINNLCFNALLAGYAAGRKQIDSAIVDQVLADLEVDPLKTKNVVTQQETLTPQRTPIILDSGLFEGSSRATWTASKPTPKTPRRLRSSLTPLLQACCHKSRSLLCRRRRRNLIQASREVSCRGERRLCRLSWTIWSPTLA